MTCFCHVDQLSALVVDRSRPIRISRQVDVELHNSLTLIPFSRSGGPADSTVYVSVVRPRQAATARRSPRRCLVNWVA